VLLDLYSAFLTVNHVSAIKIDPYLNVDAGTMNPKEFVSLCAAGLG
jgi:CTP synthase (UTP-ammonia lyase)